MCAHAYACAWIQTCTWCAILHGSPLCFTPHQCPAGKYKDTPGTAPCRKCAAGKYNPLSMSTSEALCIPCPAGADTRGLEGAVSIQDCECVLNMYMTVNRTGELGMRCFDCPAAAMCPDGSCGLRNFPSFSCSGIGSDDMPAVVGTWARDASEMYRVMDCPIGHQFINNTGYQLQECSHCPEGKYIAMSNDPSYQCFNCPPSARCPKRGRPVFPETEVKGKLELGGPLLKKEDLIQLIAQSLGADPDLISIDDYDALLASLQQARRRLGQMQRRVLSSYQVTFSVWTNAEMAEKLQANGLGSAMSNISAILSQIAPTAQFVGATSTGVNSRLPGEDWQEVEGAYLLKFVCVYTRTCLRVCVCAFVRLSTYLPSAPSLNIRGWNPVL